MKLLKFAKRQFSFGENTHHQAAEYITRPGFRCGCRLNVCGNLVCTTVWVDGFRAYGLASAFGQERGSSCECGRYHPQALLQQPIESARWFLCRSLRHQGAG